mmetsp:Transcript_52503/g.122863  ORF Transcript_52503/g.122863 Transcript_52503/m.122863 type:complete len:209 (+) Transcript_52503:2329-2955(+)
MGFDDSLLCGTNLCEHLEIPQFCGTLRVQVGLIFALMITKVVHPAIHVSTLHASNWCVFVDIGSNTSTSRCGEGSSDTVAPVSMGRRAIEALTLRIRATGFRSHSHSFPGGLLAGKWTSRDAPDCVRRSWTGDREGMRCVKQRLRFGCSSCRCNLFCVGRLCTSNGTVRCNGCPVANGRAVCGLEQTCKRLLLVDIRGARAGHVLHRP